MCEPVLPPPPVPIRENKKLPKDPDYFKKYYQNKTKLIKIKCETCNIDVEKSNLSRHLHGRKHINII